MNKLIFKLNKKQEVNMVDLITIANDSNSKIKIDLEKNNIIAEDIEKSGITNLVSTVEKYYKIVYVDISNDEREIIDSQWMRSGIENRLIDRKKDSDNLALKRINLEKEKSLDV